MKKNIFVDDEKFLKYFYQEGINFFSSMFTTGEKI
jgi:hypothetical protein